MTDTSKILLTQALTVILTPASIALTLYLIQRSRTPKPNIQYVVASPEYKVIEPSSALVQKINDDPGLSSDFRNELRRASFAGDKPESCTPWLDGGPWDADCMGTYKSVINQERGMLKAIAAQGHESIQETRASSSLKVLDKLMTELISVENTKQPRAGSVALDVGVLNVGDSDGTIFRDALLTFNSETMQVSAERYTAIGAHGFSEVTFTTAREDGGKIIGASKTGEEPIVKAWSDLVRTGNEIPFELTITLSGKKESIEGVVPKEH